MYNFKTSNKTLSKNTFVQVKKLSFFVVNFFLLYHKLLCLKKLQKAKCKTKKQNKVTFYNQKIRHTNIYYNRLKIL